MLSRFACFQPSLKIQQTICLQLSLGPARLSTHQPRYYITHDSIRAAHYILHVNHTGTEQDAPLRIHVINRVQFHIYVFNYELRI